MKVKINNHKIECSWQLNLETCLKEIMKIHVGIHSVRFMFGHLHSSGIILCQWVNMNSGIGLERVYVLLLCPWPFSG